EHRDVGNQPRRHPRLPREPKADQNSGNRTDDEGEHGFDERDPQVLPDRALDEPFDDARGDIRWRREKERRQKLHAADGHRGEELPEQHRRERDEKLKREESESRHGETRIHNVMAVPRTAIYVFFRSPKSWPEQLRP